MPGRRQTYARSRGPVINFHRSGATEDTMMADLAVATGRGRIKTGPRARVEWRVAAS